MRGFMNMANNYRDRKVDHYESETVVVDTCSVTDSDKPYETAITHKKYNDNDWVIVEMYSSKALAKIGHKKWVKKMSAKKLPKKLTDVSTADIATLCDSTGSKWRKYKQEKI